MKILKLTNSTTELCIQEAVQTLENGGLVIYPTETVYGIGVDATNENAVNKLLNYKGSRENKPFSIAVYGIDMASKYAIINKTAENIYKNFLPGPITVVSEGKHILAAHVESLKGTVGIRIPAHNLIIELVKKLNKPVTCTSAISVKGY